MSKLRGLLLFSFLCSLTVIATAQVATTTLQPNTPIERTLGATQVQLFTVHLEANSLIQFTVEQHGIDVIVKVFAPSGKPLGEYDSPNGAEGPEHVSFVALTGGDYRISVGPLNPGETPAGRYIIKIVELREASEQEIKDSKSLEAVKAKGLALLVDLEDTIAQIRSPQTRIRTQLQAAQLLAESDEKRSSKWLADAMAGLKELIASVDANDPRFNEYFPMIWQLRYEIVQLLAARDPDAALNFLYATVPLPNPSARNRYYGMEESMLELTIANQIGRDDPKRALQIARRSLKGGYSTNLLGTVSQLRTSKPPGSSQRTGN